MEQATFDDFMKLDIRVGTIVEARPFEKARTHLMRDLGAQAAPMNAFLLNLGLETLALRMERHCSNALKVAQYLEADRKSTRLNSSHKVQSRMPSSA